MIFTTKNKELAIFGKTLTETKGKLIDFFEAFERGGIRGQDGIIDTFFSKDKKSPLTPELLETFELFKDEFNSTSLSVDVLKEKFGDVDQRIIAYAKTCKNGKMTTEGFKASINNMSLSAKAGSVALKALSIAGNMIAMWAISKVISGLHELSQVSETIARNAKELGSSFKTTASDLESYKSKIEDLYETINDSTSSISDVTEARKTLMSIQDELIDKYGTEKDVIDSITEAINGQSDALDTLSAKKWQEVKNEFNDESFINGFSNWLSGYKDNIDRMVDEYGDYVSRIRLNDFVTTENKGQYAQFKKMLEQLGAEISFDFSDGNSEIAALSGNATEVFEKLLEIQNVADQFHFSDDFEKKLRNLANSAKDVSDNYKDFWNEYVLNDKILSKDSGYDSVFKGITDAYEKYLKAFKSGDENSIREATDGYAQILTDSIENAFANGDADVADYFRNMYPALQQEVEKWEFRFKILPDYDIHALKGKTQSDILEMLQTDGTQYGEGTFNSLLRMASDYGLIIGDDTEKIQQLLDLLVEWEILQGNIIDSEVSENSLFSTFINSDFGTRIQHITDLFNEGTISHKEYFDALQSEINNFDASNFTNSIEDMDKASAQFFVDSMQQAADGLSGLINSFDKGEMSISEYLEGYLAIGNTLSTLTDNLQENSAAWNEHGEAISEVGNTALDDTQNKLNSAMSIIESYQDSIYSLEQIMNDAVTVGSDEFTAHANVIAEDLYRIVQTGGEMADTIANTLGTTTSEIAQSLTENVSNQEIACQAIMANTNNAITDMASSIGELFDTLGDAISNFKVDLSFGVKSIDWKKVNVLGAELSLPEINFELGASGESLDKIGSALSSFGKTIASNYTPQTIELEDFHFGSTDAAKDRKYSPSSGITKNYEDALGRIKDATKSTSSAAKSEFSEMVDFFKQRIGELDDALSLLKTNLDNVSGSFAKNNLVDAQLNITEEKFNNYTDALAMYTQKANEALSKLPSDIAAKVKDGAVALTDFIGDGTKDVVEAIKEYESWAGEIADCKQELAELQKEIRQLELSKFTNIMDDYQNQFNLRGNSKDLISKQIALLKEAGELIGGSFFKTQIDQSQKQLALLENEKAQLVNQMSSAINSGRVNCCPLLQ